MQVEQKEVVIVGAGPGGLQMAYYLQKHNVDYVICEASDRIASFLEKYPLTRTLISFNKKYNLHDERSYNLRYDWNSLLCDNPELDFTRYTDELYPHADILVKYLRDYGSKCNLNIRFNSRVRIRRNENAQDESSRFSVIDTNGQIIYCRFVMLATGAVSENVPAMKGAELAYTYGTVQKSGVLDNLRGKEVCIIGGGVSANELGNYLRQGNRASVVRIHLRAPLKLAADTHFSGDIRSKDFDIDVWQFEMLHFWAEHPVIELTKRADGRIEVMTATQMSHWRTPKTVVAPLVYDVVIFCTGFNYVDSRLFDGFEIATNNGYNRLNETNPAPAKGEIGRFPSLNSWWETSIPGIYYIGAAAQANDRVSSSPFLRGIRYTVRSLFAHLKEKYWSSAPVEPVQIFAKSLLKNYNGDPLPTQVINCNSAQDLRELARDLAWFYTLTDSLPAMRSYFGDLLIFDPQQKNVQWWHDLPLHYILNASEEAREFYLQNTHIPPLPQLDTEDRHHFLAQEHLFILTMEYNRANYPEHFHTMDIIKPADHLDTNCSYYLHPAIRYFRWGSYVATLLIQESLYGRFAGKDDYEGFNDANAFRIHNYLLQCLGQEFFPDSLELPEGLVSEREYDDVYQKWTTENEEYWRKNSHLIPPSCLHRKRV